MNILRRFLQAECAYQRRRVINIISGTMLLSNTDWW